MSKAKSIQVQDLGRIQQIVAVLARNGLGHLGGLLGLSNAPAPANEDIFTRPIARRIRQAFIDLGPTFVKLGQVLSVRPDMLPPDMLIEFQALQDRVDPLPFEDVVAAVEAELGRALDEVFAEFDETPLEQLSIAQVHRAVLLDSGQEVAVKLQRPDIEQKIRSDIHILYTIGQMLEGRINIPGMYSPTEIVQEFDYAIMRELDFTEEMRSADRFYKNFADHDDIIIPKVYPRWSSRRLLIMELVDAQPLSTRLVEGQQATPESQALAHRLMECAYQQIFVHGFFHGDPHPGNIFVDDQDRIIILDYGLTGSLTGAMQDTIISAFTSMVFRDAETLAMTVYRAGATAERVELKEFRGEIERLMVKYYGMSLDEAANDPATLMEVINVANKFHISLPREFAVLSRTFGLIEGAVRALLPGVDIVEEVKPYAQRLVAHRFAPDRVALDVARAVVQAQSAMKDLPTQMTQVLMDLEGGKISFETRDPDARLMREEIRMGVLRLSLAMFASTVSLGALMFLAAWSPAPFGIPLFGLFGLLIGLWGASLFGALGIHVFFARFLDLGYWRRRVMSILRFFSWRRRS